MPEIEDLKRERQQFHDEALAWHGKASKLEQRNLELEIENTALKEQVKVLAIENVKLMNRVDPMKVRQYETTDFANNEQMLDNDRGRYACSPQPIYT